MGGYTEKWASGPWRWGSFSRSTISSQTAASGPSLSRRTTGCWRTAGAMGGLWWRAIRTRRVHRLREPGVEKPVHTEESRLARTDDPSDVAQLVIHLVAGNSIQDGQRPARDLEGRAMHRDDDSTVGSAGKEI